MTNPSEEPKTESDPQSDSETAAAETAPSNASERTADASGDGEKTSKKPRSGTESSSESAEKERTPGPPPEDYPKAAWLPYVLPFAIFMLVTSLFEPTPPAEDSEKPTAELVEPAETTASELATSKETEASTTETPATDAQAEQTEAGDGQSKPDSPQAAESLENEPIAGETAPAETEIEAESGWFDFLDFEFPEIWTPAQDIPYSSYPLIYTLKIALVTVSLAFFWPVYRKTLSQVNYLAYFVGVIGFLLWILLSSLNVEEGFVKPMGLEGVIGGERSAYNPFDQLGGSVWAYPFLLVRFFGLVAVVAVMEEFFLRGFVVRYFEDDQWWNVPIGVATGLAAAIPSIYGAVSHPEFLAAAIWFSLVTWLILQTRNIWDAITAHAITNLLLGIYVISTNSWELW